DDLGEQTGLNSITGAVVAAAASSVWKESWKDFKDTYVAPKKKERASSAGAPTERSRPQPAKPARIYSGPLVLTSFRPPRPHPSAAGGQVPRTRRAPALFLRAYASPSHSHYPLSSPCSSRHSSRIRSRRSAG